MHISVCRSNNHKRQRSCAVVRTDFRRLGQNHGSRQCHNHIYLLYTTLRVSYGNWGCGMHVDYILYYYILLVALIIASATLRVGHIAINVFSAYGGSAHRHKTCPRWCIPMTYILTIFHRTTTANQTHEVENS